VEARRQAKVGQLDVAAAVEQDVVGLDVAGVCQKEEEERGGLLEDDGHHGTPIER
jgi:hypothetical protein